MTYFAFFEDLSAIARASLSSEQRQGCSVRNKDDAGFDPVTNVDVAVEGALRSAIARRFPSDVVHGEELGERLDNHGRCWSIDPIDGTRAYICGLPSWAVLVGLVEDGAHVAGMIDFPALSELFIAVDGTTMRNGVETRVSGAAQLEQARLTTTDPFLFSAPEAEAFNRVRNSVLVTRFGLDALGYARVASGDLDLVIESGLKRHDFDAVIPVVRGAGGYVGDWNGGEDFSSGQLVAAASLELYEAAVAKLAL